MRRDWHRLFGLLLTDFFTGLPFTVEVERDLFERFHAEGFAMSYTMEDFKRDVLKEHLEKLSPQERRKVLESLPPEERLAGLSPEQIQHYLDQLTAGRTAAARKPRRKK